MHSHVYKFIRFKLGMTINVIVVYILILIFLTLTLIQGRRSARKQKYLSYYLTKVSINLNGIWYTVETSWCYEPHIHFI